MEGNHYLREIECCICGTRFKTTASRGTCDFCKEEKVKEINRRERANRKRKPDYFVVVYDPLPFHEGGFGRNASISMEEVRCMLRATIDALQVGTILRNPKGEKYTVIRDNNYMLKLMRVPG